MASSSKFFFWRLPWLQKKIPNLNLPRILQAINDGQRALLRDYVAKGPFWPAPQMEVATEEGGWSLISGVWSRNLLISD